MQIDNNNSNLIPTLSPNSWMTFNKSNNSITAPTILVAEQKPLTANKPIEKSKRKQVKNACVNCQKACKKCDDGRPCKRCVKLGLTATCRDSDRKERKKGVKRGPYKKRQAYIKDKPVYPKLTEEHWNTPIYENVPQVLSHSNDQSIYSDFYDDSSYCVPSQSSLSPTSSSSFVDESDETLHYAYGYGYTNNTTTATTIATSSPSASSMLDNHTISGNVTPILDATFSWDDIETYSNNASPIGCTPIMNSNDATIQFPIYQQTQQKNSFMLQQPFVHNSLNMMHQQPITTNNNYWYDNNSMSSLLYQQPQPQSQQPQNYFEYSIPSQYESNNTNTWAFSN